MSIASAQARVEQIQELTDAQLRPAVETTRAAAAQGRSFAQALAKAVASDAAPPPSGAAPATATATATASGLQAAPSQGLPHGHAHAVAGGPATPHAAAASYGHADGQALAAMSPYASMLQGSMSPASAQLVAGSMPAPFGPAAGPAGAMPLQTQPLGPTWHTPAPQNVSGDLAGLNPVLLQRLDAVGRELGQPLEVISGHRTYAEQQKLYDAYRNGTGNLAARPGTSNHESGNAADVYVNGVALASVPGAQAISERYGLHFPVAGEAWHVESR